MYKVGPYIVLREEFQIGQVKIEDERSLRVAPSFKDERVHAIVPKSLLSYITSVPNFWDVIYAKLFVK